VEEVLSFINETFLNSNPSVVKLDSKGLNDSFRVGVDFAFKDALMNGAKWPKNVTVKRFLFRKEPHRTLS